MTDLPTLRALAPDWPELPGIDQCWPGDRPVPAQDCTPLTLAWLDARRVPADQFTGHIIDSLLSAEGAFGPVATVDWAPVSGARNGRGWLWRCRVYIVGVPTERGGVMDLDCREAWRSTTRDGAREAAAEHIRIAHPDTAVRYAARRVQAIRIWK